MKDEIQDYNRFAICLVVIVLQRRLNCELRKEEDTIRQVFFAQILPY